MQFDTLWFAAKSEALILTSFYAFSHTKLGVAGQRTGIGESCPATT